MFATYDDVGFTHFVTSKVICLKKIIMYSIVFGLWIVKGLSASAVRHNC